MPFTDPGHLSEEQIAIAYQKYQKIDTGMKILEPMFIFVYRNGWDYVRQNPEIAEASTPPDHVLKELALEMPMPRLPIEEEDITGAFKMGLEDCVKAGTAIPTQ